MRATRADEKLGWDGHSGLTGLTAFIVSGPGEDSTPQGKYSCEAGATDAAMTELLMAAHLLKRPFFACESLASEAQAELLGAFAEETDFSALGHFVFPCAGPSFTRKATIFVVFPKQPFFSPNPHELAAMRFLEQAMLAYAEIVCFTSEPHFATDGQRCVSWQQSGVC
jgi:hypothetical protein